MSGLGGEARDLRFDVRTGRREIQTIVDIPHLRLEPGERHPGHPHARRARARIPAARTRGPA